MSTINLNGGKCANCGKGPLAVGIPVYRDFLINTDERHRGSGVDTALWCIDCVRELLHPTTTSQEEK